MRVDQDVPRSPALPLPTSCQCPSASRSYRSRSMSAPSPFASISAAARPPCEATASVAAYRASHPPALIADSAFSSSTPTSCQGMRATTDDQISARARSQRHVCESNLTPTCRCRRPGRGLRNTADTEGNGVREHDSAFALRLGSGVAGRALNGPRAARSRGGRWPACEPSVLAQDRAFPRPGLWIGDLTASRSSSSETASLRSKASAELGRIRYRLAAEWTFG
jgi:hypothetical protein